jgi:hypothetical protein
LKVYRATQRFQENLMKKWFGSMLMLTGLLTLVPSLRAQAVYTGSKTPGLQAGAGFLYLNNDYGKSDQGVSAWVDANLNTLLGLEAEAHLGTPISPSDYGENSFLVGPRLGIRQGKSMLYAKAMVGRGNFIFDRPGQYHSASYGLYAFGAGLDYRISPNINLRVVDAEFQTWGSFKPNGLTPYAVSTGLMYIIH